MALCKYDGGDYPALLSLEDYIDVLCDRDDFWAGFEVRTVASICLTLKRFSTIINPEVNSDRR